MRTNKYASIRRAQGAPDAVTRGEKTFTPKPRAGRQKNTDQYVEYHGAS